MDCIYLTIFDAGHKKDTFTLIRIQVMTIKTIFHLSYKNIQHYFYKLTGQVKKIIPYKVLIEVTNNCNSKCLHCDIWKVEKENISTVNLDDLASFLKKMNHNLLWLALSGGEVSIYKQLPELVTILKENNPSLRIMTFTTNGLLPQKILSYALMIKKELTCDVFITISLDGDADTHDAVRGIKGNYKKAQETYKLLKENNIPCHFGITVSESNHLFIKDFFINYVESIKAVTFFHTSGIFLTKNDPISKDVDRKITESLKVIYKNYKISSLGEVLMKISIKLGIRFVEKGRQTNVIPCDVGFSSVHILSNGSIQPCMYLPPIANIGGSFSVEDFHNAKAVKLREEIKNDHCPHCWMQCYAPHSILQSPVKTAVAFLKSV
jgi:MoaA/NifB/PqqE/SkfB family radical SAM enzyme